MKALSWGVIGGGMLGMTLSHRLAQRGHRVTLFEAADHLGGLASAWTLGPVVWDRHYHVTLMSDSYLRGLLMELGLEREIRWVETRTGFYVDGRLYSMSNVLEFLRFPPLSLVDKLRLALTVLYASNLKDGRRLERIPVADWLRRWSGTRTFERVWLPLLRAKLGENFRVTSAAFIWASITRMYAARRTGAKKEMFGYVPGGYARILERFAQVLGAEGVTQKCRHAVRRVHSVDGSGVALEFDHGARETFDRVILTIPVPFVLGLCPDLSADERARLERVRYMGVICVSVLLKRPLAGFYVTNITDGWVPFTGVIEMSALVDPDQFGGYRLVYLPKYVSSDDPAFTSPDAEIEERFLAALHRMYPHLRPEDVVCVRVSRARYVLALSTLHYSDHLPPIRTTVPGVFIVHSAQIVNGTLNVNQTVKLAEEALPELLCEPDPSEAVVSGSGHAALG